MQIDYADPATTRPPGLTGYGLEGFSLKSFMKIAAPLVQTLAPIAGGVVGSIVPGVGTVIGGAIGGMVGNLVGGLAPGAGGAPGATVTMDDIGPALGQAPNLPDFVAPAGARVWIVPAASRYTPPGQRTPKPAPDGSPMFYQAPGQQFDESTLPPGTRIVRTAKGSVLYFVPVPAAAPSAAGGVPASMNTGTVMLLGGLAVALLLARRS